MGKYALILAFTYPRSHDATYELQSLPALNDLVMIHQICKKMGIESNNITIIADIPPMKKLPSELYQCNIRTNPFPSDIFVCREISQFIENTIRGISDSFYKSNDPSPEVLLYISGHGEKININGKDNQGIVLTSEDGRYLKYLLAKDIFDIIFGNFPITNDGKMEIPIYTKIKTYKRNENGGSHIITTIGIEEKITIFLSPVVVSPQNSPGEIIMPYRSSYLTRRGIPPSTRMLIIIDTCYSEHMTYFPFIYDPKSQTMVPTSNINIIGTDLPNCITISSCEANKTSKYESSGSSLTRILCMKLSDFKGKLNIAQLHYLIYNSKNEIINNLLKTYATHPIITSTSSDAEANIPFYNLTVEKPIRIIEK